MQTTEDSVDDANETFTVAISEAKGGGGQAPVLGASSVTTTIKEVGIALSVDTASLEEDASATDIAVTATLDGGAQLSSDLTVDIELGGTAGSADYTASSLGSITISAGQSSGSGTITVTPTDDSVVEGDESITVSGSASGIDASSVNITIEDNDAATLSISGPSGEVTEGNSTVFTVTLSHSVAADVTVALSAASGSATAGSDFGAPGSTVTFAAGSSAGATQSASVAVTDDNLSEAAENFSVSLGDITSDLSDLVSLKSRSSSARATIAASDRITVSLSGPAAVNEGSETASYTVSLSDGVPTADLTVSYATADSTATAGSDYTAKSGTLTFTSADHADKTFTVSTTSDSLSEGDETFTVSLSSAAGGGGQAPTLGTSSVTTTISNVAPEPTPEAPGEPIGVRVTSTAGSLDVAVSWNDVDDADSYRVRWRKDEEGTQWNNGVSVATSSASITVASYGDWEVKVVACNDVGCSEGASLDFEVEPPPNRAPVLNEDAKPYDRFIGSHNAPRGTMVHKSFEGIFSDPDGDKLTYTVSVPTESAALVSAVGLHATKDFLLFEYDADGDWGAITPALSNPVVTEVTLTATDPDGLSVSISGDFSAHWEAPTPTGPPGRPTELTVTSKPESMQYSVSWQATEQSTHYKVMWRPYKQEDFPSGNEMRAETNSATILVSSPGQWVVRVEACNALGCGLGVSQMATLGPARPKNFSVSAGEGDLNFNATWSAVTGATSYRLQWRETGGELDVANQVIVTGTSAAFTLPDYRVWIVRLIACTGLICGHSASETLSLEPSVPGDFSVSAGEGELDFSATWASAKRATSYKLHWREVGGEFAEANQVTVTGTSKAFSVPSHGRWVVRLEGCNAAGCGAGVNKTIETVPDRPQNFAVTSTAGSLSQSATWTAVDYATSYRLRWRRHEGGFESGNVVTTTETEAAITLSDYGQWIIRLEGCNAAGCGRGASETVVITRPSQ